MDWWTCSYCKRDGCQGECLFQDDEAEEPQWDEPEDAGVTDDDAWALYG
jgi:hypothetical protein